jgi:diguanylate cyclase (GGDEF)-like protein
VEASTLKILIVEDDRLSASILLQLLTESNYTIDTAADAKTAWQYIETYTYDLLVLDIMLPDSDGIDLCTKLRAAGYMIPILLLTAKDSTSDRVMGLEAGADDYVVKPYAFQELIARIRALLRRYHDRDTLLHGVTWENLRLDFSTNTVTYNQQLLRLTQKEYGLLELFLRHPQQVFSRSVILDKVWSAGEFPSEEAVTTHIKGLRQKLKAAGISEDPIETLYGLGYRLKAEPTLKQQEQPSAIASIPLQTAEARVKEALAEITKRLHDNLAELIPMFRRVAIAVEEGNLDLEMRHKAVMEAHRLIGSLGTLGFPQGSTIARQIEQLLKDDAPLSSTDADNLKQLINTLQAITTDSLNTTNHHVAVSHPPIESAKLPLLLIVDDDVAFVQEIQLEAETWGMRVETAHSLAIAREKIDQEQPNIILLDVMFPESDNGFMLLDELAQKQINIPTVITTAKSGLGDRVMAAQRGGQAFIEKPASAEEILNTIAQVLQQQRNDRPRVMIVDDDIHILKVLQILLAQWDIEVVLLADPQQFWQVLESTAPDLLILDLNMPDYSGIDLCRAVRTASLWHDLPIVFLSSQSDRNTIRQIFTAGADDYLSKPIVEADLQTRILSRLERSRVSRQAADFDGLTGIYTHRRGIQSLTQLIRLATRNHQSLCLAILDLDLFKQVNDRYGHGMGDLVLKQFGKLLRQNFRSEDVTMRWGGEEFVVGLYGANSQQSMERLNEFLEIWRQQKFMATATESFSLTFSAGLVEYLQDSSSVELLYQRMDKALYQAKEAGRNRIVLANNS